MKVFWALITTIGRSGRVRLMRGNEVEGVAVGHDHVGDDDSLERHDFRDVIRPSPSEATVFGAVG